MVLGIVAAGFYFYYYNLNPCGTPGGPQFSALPDMDFTVNGQPRTYHAVAANFTGSQQEEVISNVAFLSTALNDPSIPHLVNGNCASDPYTPATIKVRVTFSNTGAQYDLQLTFKGVTSNSVQTFTGDYQAGLQWNPGSVSLILLVGA